MLRRQFLELLVFFCSNDIPHIHSHNKIGIWRSSYIGPCLHKILFTICSQLGGVGFIYPAVSGTGALRILSLLSVHFSFFLPNPQQPVVESPTLLLLLQLQHFNLSMKDFLAPSTSSAELMMISSTSCSFFFLRHAKQPWFCGLSWVGSALSDFLQQAQHIFCLNLCMKRPHLDVGTSSAGGSSSLGCGGALKIKFIVLTVNGNTFSNNIFNF